MATAAVPGFAGLPAHPGRPARPRSPGVVFLACFLLAGVAAVRLTFAIVDFYAYPQVVEHFSAARGDASDGWAAGLGLILLAVLEGLVAVIYLVLSVLDHLGLTAARILTWIFAGLTILVTAALLPFGGLAVVPWFRHLTVTLAAVTLVLSGAAVVLLSLPVSSRYYRAARAARRPPPPPRPLPPSPPGWPLPAGRPFPPAVPRMPPPVARGVPPLVSPGAPGMPVPPGRPPMYSPPPAPGDPPGPTPNQPAGPPPALRPPVSPGDGEQ